MPPAFLSRAPDLARLPIVVNARAVSLSEGMRAGLSVAVIIALDEYLKFAPLREAALAALLTCICDPGGPIRRRVPVLLGFALTGAAVTSGYGLLRALRARRRPAARRVWAVLLLLCPHLRPGAAATGRIAGDRADSVARSRHPEPDRKPAPSRQRSSAVPSGRSC